MGNIIDNKSQYIKGTERDSKLKLEKEFLFPVEDLVQESYKCMEYAGETIERIIKEKLRYYEFEIKYRNFYAYLLREIMRNVVEHSFSENFSVYFYKNQFKEFGFKVVDNGIGIKKSLNSNPEYNVTDNKSALAFCIMPGITKSWKRDPYRDEVWQNSGFGLYMVSSIINMMGGRFEIASGDTRLIYKNGLREYKNNKEKVIGTEVICVFNTSIKFDTVGIVRKISIKGSECLKSSERFSKYAIIKTASKASTLIED